MELWYLTAVKHLAQKLRSILGDVGVIFVTVLRWDFLGGLAPRYILSISQHLILACPVCNEVCGIFRYQTLGLLL